VPTEGFFLPGRRGDRLCVLRTPRGRAIGGLVVVHPFAEEANKSRRAIAEQARHLAGAGFAVLQIDLFGCGDSAGDFGDATWDAWLDDVRDGIDCLRPRVDGPLWLWGVRAGCLLAGEVARSAPEPPGLLLWQPVRSGNQHLTQLLRTRTVGELIGDGETRTTTRGLMDALKSGNPVEVAGYRIAPGLALGLAAAELRSPPASTRVVWLELSLADPPALLPASVAAVETWRRDGALVVAEAVHGTPFWQTVEIEECPALVQRTREILQGLR